MYTPRITRETTRRVVGEAILNFKSQLQFENEVLATTESRGGKKKIKKRQFVYIVNIFYGTIFCEIFEKITHLSMHF